MFCRKSDSALSSSCNGADFRVDSRLDLFTTKLLGLTLSHVCRPVSQAIVVPRLRRHPETAVNSVPCLPSRFAAHSYRDYADIQKLLLDKEIDGALIDAYAVGSKKQLFEKPSLRINRIYDYGSVYGVVTGGDSRKLQRCFNNYVPMNIAKISKHIEAIVDQIEVSDLTVSLPSLNRTFSQPFKKKCINEFVRIVNVIIFHLSKL